MRRENEKPVDIARILQNFTEFLGENWGIDTKELSPGLQKEYKEYNYARYAIIGGLLLVLVVGQWFGLIFGVGLTYWGYKECTKIYPRLKDDLAFYRSMHKK